MVHKIIKTMLKYKVIQRKNPIDKSVKYYAQEVEQTQMSFATLCDKISHSSTATAADASAVIKEACVHALEALLDGKSVSLGDLGSLHTTIKSKGAATAKDFEPKLLRNIRYCPKKVCKLQSSYICSELKNQRKNNEAYKRTKIGINF